MQPYYERPSQPSSVPDPEEFTYPGPPNKSYPQPYGQNPGRHSARYGRPAGMQRYGRPAGMQWPRRKVVLISLGSLVALIIIVVSVGLGTAGSGVSTDYINGYQDGYSWGTSQFAGEGNNPCDLALQLAFADGTLLDANDPNDDGSTDYNNGWSAGCDDGANNRASRY
jgi:hypothetical protein